MADETTATAPASRRNNSSSRRSARTEETLEEQIAKLQDDIRAIGVSLAKLSDSKVTEARSTAKARYRDLMNSGQHVVDDLSHQVNAYEGQLVEAIREKPLTAVLGALGVGYLIALLSRR